MLSHEKLTAKKIRKSLKRKALRKLKLKCMVAFGPFGGEAVYAGVKKKIKEAKKYRRRERHIRNTRHENS